jgi:hypothetical protein
MATVTQDTQLALSEMGHRRVPRYPAPQAVRLPASNPSNRLLHRVSPLLAHSRHELLHCKCPLSGVKRT